MVLISVDRYVAICYPLHYPTSVTERRVKLCVCLCWLCSIFYSGLFVREDLNQLGKHNSCYGECNVVVDYMSGTIDIVLTFIAPVTVIVILYIRIFIVAVSQAQAMRSHVATVTIQLSVTAVMRKSEFKAARTISVLIAVFLICFCPYYSVSLAGDNLLSTPSGSFVTYLFFINSCVNPVIYAMFYPWFRKAVKLIFTLQIFHPSSCEANIS